MQYSVTKLFNDTICCVILVGKFEECCKTISQVAFSNEVSGASDPLFINLNLFLNYNIYTMDKIADILIKYFGHRFLPAKYSYYGINKNSPNLTVNIATESITNFINKVIIICDNENVAGTKLEELINISSKKLGFLRNNKLGKLQFFLVYSKYFRTKIKQTL